MGYFACSFLVMQFSGSFFRFAIGKREMLLKGRSYIYAKTEVRKHLGQNMGRLYHRSSGCIKRVRRTNFDISKSNMRICDNGITSSSCPC